MKLNFFPYIVDIKIIITCRYISRSYNSGEKVENISLSFIIIVFQAFEADLRQFITEKTGKRVYTQVDEVGCKIRVRGLEVEHCSEFLLQKGF